MSIFPTPIIPSHASLFSPYKGEDLHCICKAIMQKLVRFENNEHVYMHVLTVVIASKILLSDGSICKENLEEVCRKLVEGTFAEQNIALVLQAMWEQESFRAAIQAAVCLKDGEYVSLVQQTLFKEVFESISVQDIRIAIVATCLYPAPSSDSCADGAWMVRIDFLDVICNDFFSLISHGYVTRNIYGQPYSFFGVVDETKIPYIPPLLNLWRSSVQSMAFLPACINARVFEERIAWYKKLVAVFYSYAKKCADEEAMHFFLHSHMVLLRPELAQKKFGTVCFEKNEVLQWLTPIRFCGFYTHLAIQKNGLILVNDSSNELFVLEIKDFFLKFCKPSSKTIFAISEDDFLKEIKMLCTASHGLKPSIYGEDFGKALALDQVSSGPHQAQSFPCTIEAFSKWMAFLRTILAHNTRVVSSEGILLLRDRNIVQAYTSKEYSTVLMQNASLKIGKKGRDVVIKILSQSCADCVHSLLKNGFQNGGSRIQLSLRQATYRTEAEQSLVDIVQVFYKKFLQGIYISEYVQPFPEEQEKAIDVALLNGLYAQFPQQMYESLIPFILKDERGGALFFWHGFISGPMCVEYCFQTHFFVYRPLFEITFFMSAERFKQLPSDILQEQDRFQGLFSKGLVAPFLKNDSVEGFLADSTKFAPDIFPVLPQKPLLLSDKSILEAKNVFLKNFKDATEPFESIVKRLKESWYSFWAQVCVYSHLAAFVELTQFPLLLAEMLTTDDGMYNLQLVPILLPVIVTEEDRKKSVFSELERSLHMLITNEHLLQALEAIPIPQHLHIQTLFRQALGLGNETPLTLRHVRVVLLASFITCLRQSSQDCAIFSLLNHMKEYHPESMLDHFRQLVVFGGICGRTVCNDVVVFRPVSIPSLITIDDLPHVFSFPHIVEHFSFHKDRYLLFQKNVREQVMKKQKISLAELYTLIEFPQEVHVLYDRISTHHFLQGWEFALAGSLFPPIVSGVSLSAIQIDWAYGLFSQCYMESMRLGIQEVAIAVYQAIRELDEANEKRMSPLFACLSTIRHGLVSHYGQLCWVPYQEGEGDFYDISVDTCMVFKKLFLSICQVIKIPKEIFDKLETQIRPIPYMECFEKNSIYRFAARPFVPCGSEIHYFRSATTFWGFFNAEAEGLLPDETISLLPTDCMKLYSLYQKNISIICSSKKRLGRESGHIFRLLPNNERWGWKSFLEAQTTICSLWDTLVMRSSQTIIAHIAKKIIEIISIHMPDNESVHTSVEKTVRQINATMVYAKLRIGFLAILQAVQKVSCLRFSRLDFQAVELAILRGIMEDRPALFSKVVIPVADTNWVHSLDRKAAKIFLGLYFSPYSRLWKMAYIADTTILDRTYGFPIGPLARF